MLRPCSSAHNTVTASDHCTRARSYNLVGLESREGCLQDLRSWLLLTSLTWRWISDNAHACFPDVACWTVQCTLRRSAEDNYDKLQWVLSATAVLASDTRKSDRSLTTLCVMSSIGCTCQGGSQVKLGVMMYRCLHGRVPRYPYFADHLIPAPDCLSRK